MRIINHNSSSSAKMKILINKAFQSVDTNSVQNRINSNQTIVACQKNSLCIITVGSKIIHHTCSLQKHKLKRLKLIVNVYIIIRVIKVLSL